MSAGHQKDKQPIPAVPGVFEIAEGQPYLVGTRCSKCGRAFFPPRYVCTYCLTDEGMDKGRLGRTGRLYAHTVIHMASKEFDPPYIFGYVVLEPENIRVPTLIMGVEDPESLKTGMEMEMVVERLRHDEAGRKVVTYKFRPLLKPQDSGREKP